MSETLISRNTNISDSFPSSFDDRHANSFHEAATGPASLLLNFDELGGSSATSSGASLSNNSNKSGMVNEPSLIDVDDENNNHILKQAPHFERERVLSDNSNDEDGNAMLFSEPSQDDMFKQLFDFYDIEKTGFIKVDHFVEITKQNMGDHWKYNEKVD